MKVPAAGAVMSGQSFATLSGRQGRIGELLGAGGQGEVYHVVVDGLPFALKWYHQHYTEIDTGLRLRLERGVRRGAPTTDFLWPLDLVEVPGNSSFGYIMPLRKSDFRGIRDLISPPPHRLELTLASRIILCQQLAHSFFELHAAGFCYQDINFGNIFVNPDTARILICDNDNVNIDGADASIYGTRKFMAPEVVRRESLPNSRTDLFSMAVLFFYSIFGWHPLDGRRENDISVLNPELEMSLYGTNPIFLFDPDTDENGPVDGVHDWIVARWQSLPHTLRQLFIRSFTVGLHDPSLRVLETEWMNILNLIPGSIHICHDCSFEHVISIELKKPTAPSECLCCGEAPEYSPILLLGSRIIVLNIGQEIRAEHLDSADDATTIMAKVESHPTRANLIGLRNLTNAPWRVSLPEGTSHIVPSGQAVRIAPGTTIEFGKSIGTISDVNMLEPTS
ncbi:serine/threonine protein kinase [Sneathiella sp. HT1-7]|uniref:serine/threonine protein kinase n=1 Tax=Sneathiella sp. HT1-7 TaxID=2887192 RepID=UPI001D150408|nr:serine/threonine-protein kinase [Sneathiella sp. HT1-7]MCC3306025.1 serine/threonine-protein kinase [Sneathiella sp. HT1-7]